MVVLSLIDQLIFSKMCSSTTIVKSFKKIFIKRKPKSPWFLYLPVFFCTFLLCLRQTCHPSVHPIIFRLCGRPSLLWSLMNNSVSHSCHYRLIELDTSSLQLMPRHVPHLFVTIGGTETHCSPLYCCGMFKSILGEGREALLTHLQEGRQSELCWPHRPSCCFCTRRPQRKIKSAARW